MKLFVMYVMNTMAVYGRAARQTCRPIVLLFYTYDGNGMRYQKIVNGVEYIVYKDKKRKCE